MRGVSSAKVVRLMSSERAARLALSVGVTLLLACFGVALAAIWTHGDVPSRLAGTACLLGVVGAMSALFGYMIREGSADE